METAVSSRLMGAVYYTSMHGKHSQCSTSAELVLFSKSKAGFFILGKRARGGRGWECMHAKNKKTPTHIIP